MKFTEDHKVIELISGYPEKVSEKLFQLRNLILETARETEGVYELVETTKWGEPSYMSKFGSTLRMDWKEKSKNKVHLYFTCSTNLVGTFRYIFGDELSFVGNRAISLDLQDDVPFSQLKKCIELTLTYHKRKHLPLLGV